jgi:nucleoside-diphosphate-sugar epimerase
MNYHKLKKIIFISSQAAMGPSVSFNSIRKATDIESPISDYGLSKLLAEHEIKKKLYGKIPYTILRPAAIYGPRDSDIFIFFKLINKHLKLVTFTKKMLQLVYVKDVVNSVVDCIKNKKTDNNCYYIANSAMYSWGDVGRIISTSVNLKTIPIVIPDFVFKFIGMTSEFLSLFTKKKKILNKQKINEIIKEYWIADTKSSYEDLNVKFTSLEIGSKITYNWYKDNKFL